MSATKDKIKSMLCVQMMSIIKTDDRNGELCYASFYHEKTVIGRMHKDMQRRIFLGTSGKEPSVRNHQEINLVEFKNIIICIFCHICWHISQRQFFHISKGGIDM
jgi:hypothetical protein